MLEQHITTPTQMRWLLRILDYDYTIQYKKGKDNHGAGALSYKAEFEFLIVSLPVADWWLTLQQEVISDPYYQQLMSLSTPQ